MSGSVDGPEVAGPSPAVVAQPDAPALASPGVAEVVTGGWAPPVVSRALVLRMQATVGNHAAAALLSRQPPAAPAAPQAPNADDARAGKELQTRATTVSSSFQSSSSALNTGVGDAVRATDATRTLLLAACERYDSAYGKAQTVLKDAKATLELQDKVVDTIIGIAIGVAVGTGAGAIVEGLEITATAAKLAAEAVGEGVEAAAAWGVGKTQEDKRDQSGDALQGPGGTSPTAMKLEVWQKLAEAYREAASTSVYGIVASDATHWADVVAGEAGVYAGGGKGERSISDIEAAVLALEKMAASQKELPAAVTRLKADTATLKAAATAQAAPDERRMEQQIWIEWMADLPEKAAHRVLDTIEDHLREVGVISGDGKSGLLPVDFENWTSEEDTSEAVDEAKRHRIDTYRDTFGPQQIGKTGTISVIAGPGSANPSYAVAIPGTRWDWPVNISRPHSGDQSLPSLPTGAAVQITAYDPGSKTLSGAAAV